MSARRTDARSASRSGLVDPGLRVGCDALDLAPEEVGDLSARRLVDRHAVALGVRGSEHDQRLVIQEGRRFRVVERARDDGRAVDYEQLVMQLAETRAGTRQA